VRKKQLGEKGTKKKTKTLHVLFFYFLFLFVLLHVFGGGIQTHLHGRRPSLSKVARVFTEFYLVSFFFAFTSMAATGFRRRFPFHVDFFSPFVTRFSGDAPHLGNCVGR